MNKLSRTVISSGFAASVALMAASPVMAAGSATYLQYSALNMNMGQTYSMSICKGQTFYAEKNVKAKSSNKKVASVSVNSFGGIEVTSQGYGKTVITVTSKGKKYRCNVAVKKDNATYLSETSKTISGNNSFLLYFHSAGTMKKQKISVASSNSRAVKIGSYDKSSSNSTRIIGVGTKKKGKATITVKCGNKKYTCKVTVV